MRSSVIYSPSVDDVQLRLPKAHPQNLDAVAMVTGVFFRAVDYDSPLVAKGSLLA